jgi:hypothetical protein
VTTQRGKPTEQEIDAQVENLCAHDLLEGEKRGDLLRYLVQEQRGGRYTRPVTYDWPKATGKQILFEFYKCWNKRNGEPLPHNPNETEESGKRLLRELADALEEYYKTLDDALIIEIQRGRGEGYEPEITWATDDPDARKAECYYIGNNHEALEYLMRRFRSAGLTAFRDTHVRPELHIRQNVDYAGMQSAFSDFLRRADTERTVATMILGWEIDEDYVRAMQNAARGHGENLKCFRLRHPMPLLNFILLDYEDLTTEVLFGWGQGKSGSPGAVFRSKDTRLVDEFNEFYDQLLNPPFSERVPLEKLLERGVRGGLTPGPPHAP